MITKERIENLVESQIEGTDRFIVEISVKPGNNIQVYLDSDTNITIADCVAISRFVEKSLDRDVEDFELEVSSAGFMPLKFKRQYEKNIGRDLKVSFNEGDKVIGKLISVTDEDFTIEVTKKKKKERFEKTYKFGEAKKVEVEPSFKK